MACVLKGSHSFTCTPRVHPLMEWTIPVLVFPAEAGPDLPTPEGWKVELAEILRLCLLWRNIPILMFNKVALYKCRNVRSTVKAHRETTFILHVLSLLHFAHIKCKMKWRQNVSFFCFWCHSVRPSWLGQLSNAVKSSHILFQCLIPGHFTYHMSSCHTLALLPKSTKQLFSFWPV